MIKLKSLVPAHILEARISDEDRMNPNFISGMYKAKQDAAQGKHMSLAGLPDDFVRGYKTIKRMGPIAQAWQDVNNWGTEKLGQLGSGLGNPIWRK